jgi:hypothetical protein
MQKDEAMPNFVKSKLPNIRQKYKLTSLKLVKEKNNTYRVKGQVNPSGSTGGYSLGSPLRFPSTRHFISGLSIPKKAGNSIFTIDKSLVQTDVDEINSGQATKSGNTFTTSSGRKYGFHDDILYPISGSGIEELSSQEYKLLKQFKNDESKALQTMNVLGTKKILATNRAALVKSIAHQFGLTSSP